MTPKEQYEARRAARAAARASADNKFDKQELEMAEIMDRIATAFERIAEALEKR